MSISVPRRARRALLAAAVPAALAAAALPSAANAATAAVSNNALTFTAAAGESNDARVSFTGLHVFIDDRVPITAGNGCVIDENGNAICVPGSATAKYNLGDGRDAMRYQAPQAARIDMGANDDTVFAGIQRDSTKLLSQPTEIVSGSGNDLVSYRFAQRLTRTSLDNLLNDGPSGKENVRSDAEHLEGTALGDTLVGSNVTSKIEQFTGGNGADTISGGAGTDVFNEGAAPNGSDTYNGGSETDRVNYGQRTAGVSVNLDNLRNDGAPGELDFVDPNVNDVIGGAGADTLTGSSGANRLSGNGGIDTLFGLGSTDTLIGGTASDKLFGGTEDDTLNTEDNTPDLIRCEGGALDRLNRDLQDVDATGCEIVNSVGKLRLTPKALVAEAGETARLRLSWSHPVGWKQLRKVELQVKRGGSEVGDVVIRPRSERIADHGAVDVVRSRMSHKGKKVTARLAVRLDERLAGKRLRLDVKATDTNGNRQLEKRAGTIRVAR